MKFVVEIPEGEGKDCHDVAGDISWRCNLGLSFREPRSAAEAKEVSLRWPHPEDFEKVRSAIRGLGFKLLREEEEEPSIEQ